MSSPISKMFVLMNSKRENAIAEEEMKIAALIPDTKPKNRSEISE
jgi:hypothetical protein